MADDNRTLAINAWCSDAEARTWRYTHDGEAALFELPGDGTLYILHFPAGKAGEVLDETDADMVLKPRKIRGKGGRSKRR